MKEIIILVVYKLRVGSKSKETLFREGFDKKALSVNFEKHGYIVHYVRFGDVDFRDNWKNKVVLYSSAEDFKGFYKSYIEDIVYGLEQSGAIMIPKFHFLRAHNNKVFMEIERDIYFPQDRIKSYKFGNQQELLSVAPMFKYPVVIKSYEGAVSRFVRMCYDSDQLKKASSEIMKTPNLVYDLKEIYRAHIRKPYLAESRYRKKAIVQNMIPGLKNDWKILVFGEKLYKLKRLNRDNDPRASGSGKFSFDRVVDSEMLDFAIRVYDTFNVPVVSLDIAKDDTGYILIEFQFVSFGSKTLEYSDHYYTKRDGSWQIVEEAPNLEREYVDSYVLHMQKNNILSDH